MKTPILLTLFLVSTTLFAARPNGKVNCSAQFGLNRLYEVHLDSSTADLEITNDAGFIAKGRAAYSYSPTRRSYRYFLQLTHVTGLKVELDADSPSVMLCLEENSCSLCK